MSKTSRSFKSRQPAKSPEQRASQVTETSNAQPPTVEPALNVAIWGPVLPSANAAAVITSYGKHFGTDGADCTALREVLRDQIAAVASGDTKVMEAMLAAQAFTLQSMFTQLALRAESQDSLTHWEAHMRMGLKVQNQCRMTLETLATIKNPPVVFARQANINNGGQQQINNGIAPVAEHPHAANEQFAQSKLLEATDGKRLDFGATGEAAASDSAMAAVGEIDRAKIAGGKGGSRQERGQGKRARNAPRARKSSTGPA